MKEINVLFTLYSLRNKSKESKKMNQKKSNIRRMTTLALLMAIVVVMSFTPLGYLRVGPLTMSLLTIPTAISAIVLGPVDGAIIGAVFGFTSLYNAAIGSSALGAAMFSINLFGTFVVCVVARILVGLCTGLIFQGLNKAMPEKEKVSTMISGLLAAVLNTVFFMGFLVLFFYNCDYVQTLVASLGVTNPFTFIIALVGVQGVIEAVLCCIVASAVSIPLRKIWSK